MLENLQKMQTIRIRKTAPIPDNVLRQQFIYSKRSDDLFGPETIRYEMLYEYPCESESVFDVTQSRRELHKLVEADFKKPLKELIIPWAEPA